jgi:hypothetical protein
LLNTLRNRHMQYITGNYVQPRRLELGIVCQRYCFLLFNPTAILFLPPLSLILSLLLETGLRIASPDRRNPKQL